MGRTRRWWGAIATALLVVGLARPAHAAGDDENRERASRSFSEAKAAFASKSYTAAATAFEEAARLLPHPATWLDAAVAWELAGEPARAAEDCDRVIALSASGAHGTDAARRLERLRPKIATVDVRGRTAVLVRFDGGEPVTLPARRRLLPGRHKLVASNAKGEPRTIDLELAAGDSRNIDVDPEPAVAEPAPIAPRAEPAPERHAFDGGPPALSWIAFGVAGAGAVVTTVFGIETLDAKSSFEATPTRETLDTFRRDRAITNVALGATVLAAAVGVAVWLWMPRERAERSSGLPLGLVRF